MSTSIRNMILLTTIAVILFSCSSDSDSTNPPPIISETYEPCCGLESMTTFEMRGHKIYVPNVFTPNDDGINDLFYPVFSSDSITVQGLSIYTPETSMSRTMYGTVNLITTTDFTWAWDGKNRNSDLPDIDEYRGYFRYSFFANYGEIDADYFEGYACVVRCDDEAKIFRQKEGCLFATQYDEDTGEGDDNIPDGEDECIGE